MFGYDDSDRCGFDLWSPVDDQCGKLDTIYTKLCSQLEDQGENLDTITHLYSQLNDRCEDLDTIYTHPHLKPGFPHATENRAFSPYAKHQQELDDIVQISIQKFLSGESNFTLEVDDDFSEGDLAYIEKEIYRLLGE